MDNTTTKQKLQLHEITALILQAFNNHIHASKPPYRDNTDNPELLPQYDDLISVARNEAIDQYNNNLKGGV